MNVRQIARSTKSGLDCLTKIYTNNIVRPPGGSELGMSTLSAAAFENDFAAKEIRSNRIDPTEKLFTIAGVFLREVRPLPAKTFRGGLLITLD